MSPYRPLRILCISPIFTPIANSEAFCGAKMVKALREEAVEVEVLFDDTRLYRPEVTPDNSSFWNDPVYAAQAITASARDHKAKTLLSNLRYWAFGAFPYWVQLAVNRAQQLHAQDPFDFVYSRSVPMFAHIAGYWCSRRLRLPWAINLSDPWDLHQFPQESDVKLSSVRRYFSDYWQRMAMTEADLITYPCRRLGEYNNRMAHSRRSFTVIPHIGYAAKDRCDGHGFHLVHAGKLGIVEFSYGRSAAGLLNGLAMFLNEHPEARFETKLTFVGPRDPESQELIDQLGLSANVEAVGAVNYEESLKHIAGATACVLVEVKMDNGIYLPSKMADYVVAGKPVLALSPAVGTIADMQPDPGIVRADTDNPAGIARGIAELYADYRGGRLDQRKPSAGLVRMFDPLRVADAFLEAVEEAGIRKRVKSRPRGVIYRAEQAGHYRLSSDQPLVSVVVATYGREEVLCDTIRMVLSEPYDNKELVIVDQTTKHAPETQNYLESVRDSIRYIRMDGPDLTGAENLGIQEASGEIVLFIDDDVEFEPGLIESHVRNYVDESVAAVTGLILDRGRPPIRRLPRICRNHRFGHLFFRHDYDQRVAVANVAEGNMSFRRQVLLDIGPVDRNFVDIALLWGMDLAVRVVKEGGRIVHDPECRLVHLKSPRGGVRTREWKPISAFRNVFYYIYKHLASHQRFSVAMRYYFYRVMTSGWRRPWRIPAQTAAFFKAWKIERREAENREEHASVIPSAELGTMNLLNDESRG